MCPRIIFCAAVSLAIIAVMLLALVSPVPHLQQEKTRPSLALSFYIQQPKPGGGTNRHHPVEPSDAGALVFHRTLTNGPENTSQVVGRAEGFIIPIEHFAQSAFNIIYLTFDTKMHSGSLSIQAKDFAGKEKRELTVVGGTGSFAFVRGFAVFAQTEESSSSSDATFHIKLHLRFPKTIRG